MINEQIKVLNKIYSLSEDTHSILTPISLCDEMINSLNIETNKSILVVSNMEFLISLRKINVDMNNVHYTTSCPIKKQFAENIGVSLNNIHNLEYNNKEINFGTEDMKFDYIVQNPPYNPNSLWKKFVLKCIDLLNENGKMVVIHPSGWRESSTHNKLCNHLKEHISELHINDYEIWKEQKVAIKTDWYLYNKNKQNQCQITYSNGDTEILNLKNVDKIFRFKSNSIIASIFNKITRKNYHNGIILKNTGFDPLYKSHVENGKYKQCGGEGRGTSWVKGDYTLTNEPTEYQFVNKIVMAYAGKPRATFFKDSDEVGCLLANILLTDNINANPESICLLYNSEMFWKIVCAIVDPDKNQYKPYGTMSQIPNWIWPIINIENCYFTNDQEMYEHFGLTQEEIDWIENE